MAIRKVCVAMSGGVDSAGAALLLRQQGYEVFGVTLRLRSAGASDPQEQDIADARSVADTLGIPHTVLDLRELFQRQVLLFSLYRLLILPLIVLAVLIVLPLDPLSMKVCVLLTAMPAANTTVMLAGKYDRDPAFASELVMTSTLLSLFTIPLISGLLSLI